MPRQVFVRKDPDLFVSATFRGHDSDPRYEGLEGRSRPPRLQRRQCLAGHSPQPGCRRPKSAFTETGLEVLELLWCLLDPIDQERRPHQRSYAQPPNFLSGLQLDVPQRSKSETTMTGTCPGVDALAFHAVLLIGRF